MGLLLFDDADSISATTCRAQVEDGARGHLFLCDGVGLWIGFIICIGSIGVNSGDVFAAFIEEVELQTRCMSLLSRRATNQLSVPLALRAAVIY